MTALQLDLFGQIEEAESTAEAAVDIRARELATWEAKFERADWVAPYDCGVGPTGTVVLGYRCPDPDCGEVEINGYILAINHGFDPQVPDRQPWNGRCARLTRQALRDRVGAA